MSMICLCCKKLFIKCGILSLCVVCSVWGSGTALLVFFKERHNPYFSKMNYQSHVDTLEFYQIRTVLILKILLHCYSHVIGEISVKGIIAVLKLDVLRNSNFASCFKCDTFAYACTMLCCCLGGLSPRTTELSVARAAQALSVQKVLKEE